MAWSLRVPAGWEAVANGAPGSAAEAHEAGADAMVTACPMCSANVDGRQLFRGGIPFLGKRPEPKPVPIFYFTELMALAYGLPMAKVLGKHYVDPRPLLDRLGLA